MIRGSDQNMGKIEIKSSQLLGKLDEMKGKG